MATLRRYKRGHTPRLQKGQSAQLWRVEQNAICYRPIFWWPWLQLLQGVVSTSSVYRELLQETLASQPAELAGCLILVRLSPLRWAV